MLFECRAAIERVKIGAEEGIRTPTMLPPPAPQAGASASSATSAPQGWAQSQTEGRGRV